VTVVQRASDEHDLDSGSRDAIAAIIETATTVDGTEPVDDQVRLDLQHPSPLAAHLVAVDNGTVLGYAHVDLRSDTNASGHVVVAPSRRRQGVGRALVASMSEVAGDRSLAIWSHGNGQGARALSAALGWASIRELRQLLLPLTTPIGDPVYPDDVTVRSFEPGKDERAWVDVNAQAFASHPEQGRMTVEDLTQREEQSWFDPEGFFLAERDGVLLGSHWTKIHAHDDGSHVGEVYVVGVSPRAQGLGLGKALTLTGLHYLRDRGLDVILFVDAENAAAVALYERLGFETIRVDVQYAPAGQ